MASIEFIQKRIDGKKSAIEKLNKKIVRIRKAQETDWEVNPYGYYEDDLTWALRDLDEAQKSLEKYEAELETEMEKANSRNVPIILEFLEMWKAKCREYYTEGMKQYYSERTYISELSRRTDNFKYGTQEYKDARNEYEEAYKTFKKKVYGYYETYTYTDMKGKERKAERKIKDGEYEAYNPYISEKDLETAEQILEKDLIREAERKYDFIIERTNAIVGKIEDASGLSIGNKGDLNGIITGTKGKAKVNTIGAGGYNIQCYHFRTLISEVK